MNDLTAKMDRKKAKKETRRSAHVLLRGQHTQNRFCGVRGPPSEEEVATLLGERTTFAEAGKLWRRFDWVEMHTVLFDRLHQVDRARDVISHFCSYAAHNKYPLHTCNDLKVHVHCKSTAVFHTSAGWSSCFQESLPHPVSLRIPVRHYSRRDVRSLTK